MPTHVSSLIQIAVLLGAGLVSTLAGCSTTATPSADLLRLDGLRVALSPEPVESNEPAGAAALETSALNDEALVDVLALPHWIRSVPSSEGEPSYRWVYPALEGMLSQQATNPPDLKPHLNSDDPVVAANAAIGLLRTGDSSCAEHVAEAAGQVKLDVKLRCAAAESLGRAPAGTLLLQRLADAEAQRGERPGSTYSPAVHAELVRALGHQIRPTDEPRLTSALTAQADEVKLAALDAWLQSPDGTFPEQGLRLRNHRDPKIRAQRLAVLARHPSHDTFDQFLVALSDPDLQVRSAAIQALGVLGDERAVATLEALVANGVEAERIEAVRALAELGETEAVAGAAGDKAWRVRQVVAGVLPELPGDPDVALARRLLDDPSAEVQHQAVAALQAWPPGVAEPLLIEALEGCPYRSQKLAAETLAATWAEGRPLLETFPFGQSATARAAALAEIRQAFAARSVALNETAGKADTARISFSDEQLAAVVRSLRSLHSAGAETQQRAEAIGSLRQVGPDLIDILEHLVVERGFVLPEGVFTEVLGTELPDFAIVEQLARDDIQARRRAARQLAEDPARSPRPLLMRRLADLVVTETDAAVWQYLLAALADQDDPQTFRLLYAAVGHESAGIRQMACEHLRRHPRPEHVPVLVATLDDASESVTCAAVEALGFCGGNVDPAAVCQLLAARSETVQIAAAVTLTRLGRPEGPAALERLAYSTSEHTRLRVARLMGDLAQPEFAPTLIRLLDDRHGIRLAALRSLPQVAHCEDAEAADLLESDRVEAWRKWAGRAPVGPR